MDKSKGSLKKGETHPSAKIAADFISKLDTHTLSQIREGMASSAKEGSRVSEICEETLTRVLAKEPVSDRYILGLAWFLMDISKAAHIQMVRDLVDAPKGVVPDSVYKVYPDIRF